MVLSSAGFIISGAEPSSLGWIVFRVFSLNHEVLSERFIWKYSALAMTDL
jgi:hypothetical protein